MKNLFLIMVSTFLASSTYSQSVYRNASYFLGDEPMAGFRNLQASDELVFHWTKHYTPDYGRFYYDFLDEPLDSLHRLKYDEITPPVSQLGNTAGAAGDLDGDMVDELVTLIGINSSGNYLIRSEVLTSLEFIEKYTNVTSSTVTNPDATPLLLSGNIDTTYAEEIILIHELDKNAANEVFLSIEILGLNAAGNGLEEKKIFQLPLLDVEKQWSACLSDLDLDGQLEISIVAEQSVDGANKFVLHILKCDDIDVSILNSKMLDFNTANNNVTAIGICSGDFDGDVAEELGVGIIRRYGANDQGLEGFIYQVVDTSFGTTSADTIADIFEKIVFVGMDAWGDLEGTSSFPYISVMAGDVLGNGQDEFVLWGGRHLATWAFNDTLDIQGANFGVTQSISGNYNIGNGYPTPAFLNDLDEDGIKELIVHQLEPDGPFYRIGVYQYNLPFTFNLNLTTRDQREIDDPAQNSDFGHLSSTLVLGDFDGGNLSLGRGRYFKKTDFQHPLVILNAPPVHFDRFDNMNFDINDCFNGGDCAHYSASYKKEISLTFSAETEVRSAWSSSINGSLEVSTPFGNAKGSIEKKYGKSFSKYKGSSETISITSTDNALSSNDDKILASVVDYDVWEYPIYKSADTLVGYILSVSPGRQRKVWSASKNEDGYLPSHEIHNMLSYNNTELAEGEKIHFITRQLNPSSNTSLPSGTFEVSISEFSNNSVQTTKAHKLTVSASVQAGEKILGVGAEVTVEIQGSYSSSELSTHSTTVSEAIKVKASLGWLNENYANTDYWVTPIFYWAKSGALVLDYEAEPITSGSNPTWWQLKYGANSDPALILPFKLDPEKGKVIGANERYKSKSVFFSNNDNPKVGDTISIFAKIHNWSLQPTEDPVKIGFYICDPSSEHNRLLNPEGLNYVMTNNILEKQGSEIVEFKWVIPTDAPRLPRIYARIDPDNIICDEIHENNNIGWAELSLFSNNLQCGNQAVFHFDQLVCGFKDCQPSISIDAGHLANQYHQSIFNANDTLWATGIVTGINSEKLEFNASKVIQLEPGFEVETGASLQISAKTCNQ